LSRIYARYVNNKILQDVIFCGVSFDFIKAQINKHLPATFLSVKNGQCRFLSNGNNPTDSQGFPANNYTPRTVNYFPCVWRERAVSGQDVDLSTRASSVFEIVLETVSAGADIVALESDRLELLAEFGADETSKTLEIVSIASNIVSRKLICIDLKLDE
jgi:hypothetical protein